MSTILEERSASCPDGEACAALIRRFGFWELAGHGGCLCGHMETHCIKVSVSCRKSLGAKKEVGGLANIYGTTVRVSSRHLYCDEIQLRWVADEIVRQIEKEAGHLPVKVSFKEYAADRKCLYCGNRVDSWDQPLCNRCVRQNKAVELKGLVGYVREALHPE